MNEVEVRAISLLREPANAVIQVLAAPRFATAHLELAPLCALNPGPNHGESWFTYRGEWSAAVRRKRGARCVSPSLAPGDVVRVCGAARKRMRFELDPLHLGARIGIRHALDAPQLLDIDWLLDGVAVATARDVNQGRLVSASFDSALWFAVSLGRGTRVSPLTFHGAVRCAMPPDTTRLLVYWDRVRGIGGRDVLTFVRP